MKRVVVCPYCNQTSPGPTEMGLTYDCLCGATFTLVEEKELGIGLVRLMSGLFEAGSLSLLELMESCQVTVYHDFEIEPEPQAPHYLSEFVREVRFEATPEKVVDLIWVARQADEDQTSLLDQIQN